MNHDWPGVGWGGWGRVVQDKIDILCDSDNQRLEGSALVSTGSGGLQGVASITENHLWLATLL